MTCPSCGGVIGRDCFNPQECAWITQQMHADYAVRRAFDEQAAREHAAHCAAEWNRHVIAEHEQYMTEELGFDPIAIGM